jgi:hypothetical protein
VVEAVEVAAVRSAETATLAVAVAAAPAEGGVVALAARNQQCRLATSGRPR